MREQEGVCGLEARIMRCEHLKVLSGPGERGQEKAGVGKNWHAQIDVFKESLCLPKCTLWSLVRGSSSVALGRVLVE